MSIDYSILEKEYYPCKHFELILGYVHIGKILGGLLYRSLNGLSVQGSTRIRVDCLIKAMLPLPTGSRQRLCQISSLLNLLNESSNTRTLLRGPLTFLGLKEDGVRLQRIYRLIHERLPEVPSQTELANQLTISVSDFGIFFRRNMNRSYMQYAIELRIELACRSLQESKQSIGEIAFEAGFNNLSNFYRQFKKMKRISPLAFRRLSRCD